MSSFKFTPEQMREIEERSARAAWQIRAAVIESGLRAKAGGMAAASAIQVNVRQRISVRCATKDCYRTEGHDGEHLLLLRCDATFRCRGWHGHPDGHTF